MIGDLLMRKVILDVDTGSDDAIAIMTAILSTDIQLEAICTVAGNKEIDKTTENTLRVVDLMCSSVPVYKGCKEPLVKFLCPDRLGVRVAFEKVTHNGKEVQMHSDFLSLPESKSSIQRISAAEFYVQYLRVAPTPITIVAVGPLTNIATALMLDDTIINNIEEIVVMGGGYNITNVTPAAEFNIWYDPEAAQRVINCGAKVTLVPLDATHKAFVTKQDAERFRELNTVSGNFAASLCEQRIIMHNATQPLDVPDAAAVHDPLCIAYLVNPSVLKNIKEVHCEIGFRDFSEGQTIIDSRYYPEEANCRFAFSSDRSIFTNFLYSLFANDRRIEEKQ